MKNPNKMIFQSKFTLLQWPFLYIEEYLGLSSKHLLLHSTEEKVIYVLKDILNELFLLTCDKYTFIYFISIAIVC